LIANPAQITLLTHIARPKKPTAELSTQQLIPLFKSAGFNVSFVPSPEQSGTFQIQIMENLRFFPGELGSTKLEFAKTLARLGSVFIQDAFGAIHRDDCSMTQLPALFSKSHRGIGPQVQIEIEKISQFKLSNKQPFTVVLGGSKIATKTNLLQALISATTTQKPETIILGGLLPLAFLDQATLPGSQKSTPDEIEAAQIICLLANDNNVSLILPHDFVYNDQNHIVDIGPKSLANLITIISKAKKIFINGTMGYYENKISAQGTKQILTSISNLSDALCVAGGGDASAAIAQYGLQNGFDFISTGGGATLAFLASKKHAKELPGLTSLV
jgi:phosphoglycerate kinase